MLFCQTGNAANVKFNLKKFILYLTGVFLFTSSTAQIIEIKGKVTDSLSGIPLAGAIVNIGSAITQANDNGYFVVLIEKSEAEKNFIYVSYIGYKKKMIQYQASKFVWAAMDISNNMMEEVIVSTGAEKIIRKAIERIPVNYPTEEFTLDGIFRLYKTEIDSPKIYRFFKSDAVVKIFYPSYLETETDTKTTVIQNKAINLYPFPAPYDSTVWVGGYFVDDFVHRRADFISSEEVKNFRYSILGKTILQGTTTWIVKFESKRRKKAEGIVFIDTASYAFVAAKYSRYNIVKLRRRTIKQASYDVVFQKIDNKWYLLKKSNKLTYLFPKAESKLSTDFIRTSVNNDLSHPAITKVDFVKTSDEEIRINKPTADSNWIQYDSLFVEAEKEKEINFIPIPVKNPTDLKNENYLSDEDDKPFHKRIDYLENTKVRISISLDYLNIRSSANYKGSLGVGFGAGLKIYQNTYLHVMMALNFKDANKIITSKTGLAILHSINISKINKPIYLTPSVGVNFVELTNKQEKYKRLYELSTGIGISYPAIPKLRPFLNIRCNKTIRERGSLQSYFSTPISASLGTFFSF